MGCGVKRIAPMALSALILATNLGAATFYVTVAGLGGEPEYEQRFSSLAQEIDKLVRAGGPEAKVTTLYGPQATKAQVAAAMAQIAKDAKPSDAVALMLIGHGSFDGFEYKINLPGPDLSGVEIASMLDRIPATRQLVVNMTSSSGGSRAALEKPGRIVITATKSGNEKNATVFARYWVEALRDASADTDKNESVSALEAFTYADQKTTQFYDTQKRLATEHPVLENGARRWRAQAVRGKWRGSAGLPLHHIANRRYPVGRRDSRKKSSRREARATGRTDRQIEVRKGGHAV